MKHPATADERLLRFLYDIISHTPVGCSLYFVVDFEHNSVYSNQDAGNSSTQKTFTRQSQSHSIHWQYSIQYWRTLAQLHAKCCFPKHNEQNTVSIIQEANYYLLTNYTHFNSDQTLFYCWGLLPAGI